MKCHLGIVVHNPLFGGSAKKGWVDYEAACHSIAMSRLITLEGADWWTLVPADVTCKRCLRTFRFKQSTTGAVRGPLHA
jgi:hypothetical protein